MTKTLIYDIGAANGDDSAYYLYRGFRVVAVEASPVAARLLRERFHEDLLAGRLTLLEAAIAREHGQAEFWICDDQPVWSSFDRRIASREGSTHHAVAVRCRPFASVIEEFGVPYYCKIDIEGHDHVCVESLAPESKPRYLSMELAENRGVAADFDLLEQLGYNRFKLMDQVRFCLADPRLYVAEDRLGRWGRVLLETLNRPRCRVQDASWRFPPGSSGPIAPATPGAWRNRSQAQAAWKALLEQHSGNRVDVPWPTWFDVHATTV